LFIDGNTLWSRKGTAQGDPLAMPIYAISLLPLIRQLSGLSRQVWYADDAAAGGRILQLQQWWNCLSSSGHHLGYFTNARKTWLVVKNKHLEHAPTAQCFGRWIAGLNRLVSFALTQPQASYLAFT